MYNHGNRLELIASFVQVVASGGFTAAASRLGTSRAVVSKHVIALERRLGVQLLNRTTRRVVATEAGLVSTAEQKPAMWRRKSLPFWDWDLALGTDERVGLRALHVAGAGQAASALRG